jgi:hypothetical protein
MITGKITAQQALPALSEDATKPHPLKLTNLRCGWTNTLAADRLES